MTNGMQVHEGMMQAATFVHTNAYAALQAAAERFPGWPVMLTGHSMGGAWSLRPGLWSSLCTMHACATSLVSASKNLLLRACCEAGRQPVAGPG